MSSLRRLLSPEELFVLESASAFISNGNTCQVHIPEDFDWDRVARIVSTINTGPVFDHLFHAAPRLHPAMDAWRQLRLKTLSSNIRKFRVAARLFALFDGAGIPAVGLRGVTLANLYYFDPGLRPMRDLDILVAGDDHPRVQDAMRSAGFEPSKVLRSQLVYLVEGVEVELHFSLLTAKRYRAFFDSDMFLASRIKVETNEGTIYRLSIEHELLELVAHAFVHHELRCFTQLMDIAMVMTRKDLDWGAVALWCEETRLTTMFLFTLSLTAELFGLHDTGFAGHFPKTLAYRSGKMFRSYLKLYFGGDTLVDFLYRKRNLILVAERPMVKIGQLCRMFSARDIREMLCVFNRERTAEIRNQFPDGNASGVAGGPHETGHVHGK